MTISIFTERFTAPASFMGALQQGHCSGLGFTKVIKKGKWVTAHGGYMADLIKK